MASPLEPDFRPMPPRLYRALVRLVLVAAILIAALLTYAFWPTTPHVEDLPDGGARYAVRILRDEWGVPHIFGQTDVDVAFGLAYAHAEDDFITIQQSIIAARGELARVYGRNAAANDYLVHLLRLHETMERHAETRLSPTIRAMLQAYADGLTHYAAQHPDEVLLDDIFPLTANDILAPSLHKAPLFFGLDDTLTDLLDPNRGQETTPTPLANRFDPLGIGTPLAGSNAIAVSPRRSANGETFLLVNSHQPWEGPVAWYEAHVHSEEGLDMVGATWPGVPVIIHGHNRALGWAFTVNKPDVVDVYRLEINPDNPNQYWFDGEWRDFEVDEARLRVKLLGRIEWTFTRQVLWSVHGPALRTPTGTYAVRYAGMDEVGYYEQLYRMNKARTFEEWLDAMRYRALAMFNTVYADREGNIFYLYNARVPVRSPEFDWQGDLPGTTSAALWMQEVPFEALPQVLNPASGFVQSTNATPFRTTVGDDNPSPDAYDATWGIETRMTNRAYRALELFGGDSSITADEFYTYKYDMAYSTQSAVARTIARVLANPPEAPEIQEALDLLASWDLQATPENRGAALVVLWLQPFGERLLEEDIPDEELHAHLLDAVRFLRAHYDRLDPRWEEVNHLKRGDLDIGLGGAPDVLHAVYSEPAEDGHLHGRAGDSYILIATWTQDGALHSQSIHQYGAATSRPESPHYADQALLFIQRKMKPVWMDEAEIREHLERAYQP